MSPQTTALSKEDIMQRLLLNEEMKAETLPITYKIVTDWDGFPKAEVRFTEEAMNFRGGTFEILNGRVTAKHVVARKVPTKDLYEDFKYETKLWPRTVAKFLNKLGKEVREKYEEYGLIDDLDHELSRKYFYSRYLKSSSLRQYWHNRTVMRELHADDMLHMLPYYLAIKTEWTNNYRSDELTMSTVRKLMGKSMWKWALHQSYHRNSVIADVVTSRACRKLRPDQMHKLINMPVWKIKVYLQVTKYRINEVNLVALEYLDHFVRAGRTDDELQTVLLLVWLKILACAVVLSHGLRT
jgi:hypothetical protein